MFFELEVIGISGLLLILTAYFLNYQKLIKRDSRTYDFMNFFGGFFLLLYSLHLKGLAFILLQTIWTLIALYHIIKREFKILKENKKGKKMIKKSNRLKKEEKLIKKLAKRKPDLNKVIHEPELEYESVRNGNK